MTITDGYVGATPRRKAVVGGTVPGMSDRRTEHKSLQGVTEQPGLQRAPESKDVPAPVDEPEPTVRVRVVNWFHDDAGTLHGPSEDPDATVTIPARLARTLGPVYVEPVQ